MMGTELSGGTAGGNVRIRIGTRQSALALAQTELVAAALRRASPGIEIEIVKKTTHGDKNLSAPLVAFGGKGAFVTEFENLILDGTIDIAVHSAKDLPADLAPGLRIAAVLPRGDVRDVLVWRRGAARTGRVTVGTSSARRELQIKARLDCDVKLLRGNVPTRLEKLRAGGYDAIILAAAGLERLGLLGDPDFDYEYLGIDGMVPAGGQGIIAVECAVDNVRVNKLLTKINDETTLCEFDTERYILHTLNCGCHEPTAVCARVSGGTVEIRLAERGARGELKSSIIQGGVRDRLSLAEALISTSRGNTGAGTVYLVGAGPGDVGLVSVRAQELLSSCDVLVYDNLANPLLLEAANPCTEKIFAGKIPGAHSMAQDTINALLIQKARTARRVVRLKGGDPFVFGRGGEEAIALERAGIAYELVPGVTSAVAALEAAGIPVTHRGAARSFHVITAHTAEGADGQRFAQYAPLLAQGGTLVFMMGVQHIKQIAYDLVAGGAAADTPAAIVEQGTTVRTRRTDGTLATVADAAHAAGVRNPAVIAVGRTAAYRLQSSRLPFAGKKIAVTGTAAFIKKVAPPLRDMGATVLAAPILHIAADESALRAAPAPEQAAWLVFTSANGVRVYFDFFQSSGADFRALSRTKFCVVGSGTAAALRGYGFSADFVPRAEFSVGAMAEEFVRMLVAERQRGGGLRAPVVAIRAAEASEELDGALEAAGIEFRDIPAYRTVVNESARAYLVQNLDVLDALTLASASGVHAVFGDGCSKSINPQCICVCIGHKTRSALESYRVPNRAVTAREFTAAGLVRAVTEALAGGGHAENPGAETH